MPSFDSGHSVGMCRFSPDMGTWVFRNVARHIAIAVVGFGFLFPTPTVAGLHLAMKLTCKRYGDAFANADVRAMASACTPRFAEQWLRVPPEALQMLSKNGRRSAPQVLSSMRDGNGGTVAVTTDQGIMTFVLLPHGSDWRIADIYKPNDDGRPISLCNYLDATLTANEFITKLKRQGGSSFHQHVSREFAQAFGRWNRRCLDRIRGFLPEPKLAGLPSVRLGETTGTVRLRPPGGHANELITFFMVYRNGWKVDDFAIETRTTKITSFKDALPVLVATTAFGEFCKSPTTLEPASFTEPGKLRDALLFSRTMSPSPFPPSGKPMCYLVADDFLSVELEFPGRRVRMCLPKEAPQSGVLCDIEICGRTSNTSIADLILMQKHLTELASMNSWTGLFDTKQRGTKPQPLPSTTPGVKNAVARLPEKASVDTVFAVASAPSKNDELARPSHPVQHVSSKYHTKPLRRTKREPIRGVASRVTPQSMTRTTARQNSRHGR